LSLEVLEDRSVPSTVTNLSDHDPGSLRDAIAGTAAGGIVDFQADLTGTITLTTGELAIDADLTIDGPGAGEIIVSGNQASRVFDIAAPAAVTLSGLTIANGQSDAGGGIWNAGTLALAGTTVTSNIAYASVDSTVSQGGGIYNSGTLVVADSTISGNTAAVGGGSAAGTEGGGIYNSGSLSVADSTISGNQVSFGTVFIQFRHPNGGGGIYNSAGAVSIAGSTLSNNTVQGYLDSGSGGGIYNDGGNLSLMSSTLSGNLATGGLNSFIQGGGLYNNAPSGMVTISYSTITGNHAIPSIRFSSSAGGGVYNDGAGTLNLFNTIVAGNAAQVANDVAGVLTSQGHNLIGDGTGAAGFTDTDLVGTTDSPIDPLLGPLQDNGGPTQTMALLAGSAAIGAGDPTNAPDWDQRGEGFSRVVNGIMDIGAFQTQASGDPRRQRQRSTAATTHLALLAHLTGWRSWSRVERGHFMAP
jgi:hypothetical protein